METRWIGTININRQKIENELFKEANRGNLKMNGKSTQKMMYSNNHSPFQIGKLKMSHMNVLKPKCSSEGYIWIIIALFKEATKWIETKWQRETIQQYSYEYKAIRRWPI